MFWLPLTRQLEITQPANTMVKPLLERWYMREEDVAALQARTRPASPTEKSGAFAIGRGGLDARAAFAWALVGLPLAWGVWVTLSKSLMIFR